MLLGSLIIGMNMLKLKEYQLPESFSGRSIKQFRLILQKFVTPVWYSSSGSYHGCDITDLVDPEIRIIWKNLNGLKLEDYQAKQND